MPRHRSRALPAIAGPIAFLVCALAGPPAIASLVRELDFLSLHGRAVRLFHGRCTARNEFPEAKPVPYTEYTFDIIEAVKGCSGADGKVLKSITFRHPGTRSGYVRGDGLAVAPLHLGVPEHEVGEEAVLFLTRESRLGLCAPVGLTQGKFAVARVNGKATVKNGLGNCGLFEKLEAASFRGLAEADVARLRGTTGAIELKQFLEFSRRVKE